MQKRYTTAIDLSYLPFLLLNMYLHGSCALWSELNFNFLNFNSHLLNILYIRKFASFALVMPEKLRTNKESRHDNENLIDPIMYCLL